MTELIDAAIEIAEFLDGQCVVSLDAAIEAMVDDGTLTAEQADDPRLLAALDERIFCCDICGWYCSTDELHNDGDDEHCDQCHETEDEE